MLGIANCETCYLVVSAVFKESLFFFCSYLVVQ